MSDSSNPMHLVHISKHNDVDKGTWKLVYNLCVTENVNSTIELPKMRNKKNISIIIKHCFSHFAKEYQDYR